MKIHLKKIHEISWMMKNVHQYKKENYKIKDIINQLMKLNILRNSV